MDNTNTTDIDKTLINSLFKKLSKDVVKYLPSKFIPALIGLISLPIYTAIFSPDEYGIYSIIISAVNLLSSIISSWLSHSALRYYDEYKQVNREKEYYSTPFGALILSYSSALFISAVIWVSPINIGLDSGLLVIMTAVLVLTASAYKISHNILRGARYAMLYSIFSILLPGGKLLLVLLLHEFLSFLGVLVILLATMIIELLIILIFLIKMKPRISLFGVNKCFMLRMLRFGMPLLFNTTLSWILSVSDRYLIGFFRSFEETGLYAISYNIGDKSLNLVFTSLMLAAYPVIIKTWNKYDKEHVEVLLSKLIKYFYILCIPIASALFVISPLLINILAADEYFAGYMVLPWVEIDILMKGLSRYLNKIWELSEKTSVIVVINFTAAVSNIILNLLFIPRFGFIAAGITTFASYTIYFLIALILLRGKFNLKLFNKNLVLIIISSLLMLIPVSYLHNIMSSSILSFLLIVLVGAGFYFSILYLMGVIKKEVRVILKRI